MKRVTDEQAKVTSLCNTSLCPKECPYYKYDNCPTAPSKKEFALDLLEARELIKEMRMLMDISQTVGFNIIKPDAFSAILEKTKDYAE